MSVHGLPRGCAIETSALVETVYLTLNSFGAEMRKESDTLTVPQESHDLNPILVFNYLYLLVKKKKRERGVKRQQRVYTVLIQKLQT